MFTGIVKGLVKIDSLIKKPGAIQFSIELPEYLISGLDTGASVAVNGVCLTVIKIDRQQEGGLVWFDAIQETLERTNLNYLKENDWVNVERSARFGDEIGGHILSGHIMGTIILQKKEVDVNFSKLTLKAPKAYTKYLFPKGYVALDGVSLTVVNVDPEGYFTVHLIPETLQRTLFGIKEEGDLINMEIDSQTQIIVDTLERIQRENKEKYNGLT